MRCLEKNRLPLMQKSRGRRELLLRRSVRFEIVWSLLLIIREIKGTGNYTN
jgi:hypothetical protein